MDLGLRDNVVFIAGSSRGIGQAIAHAFLKEQAKVVITGRNKGSLEEARNLLGEEASENQVLTVHGDMTDPIDIQRALEETISLFGNIDAVVANVGSGSARGGWELTSDDWWSVLNTNLLGSMLLATAAFPHLISRGGGSLTFMSSIAGCEAIDAPVTYSAAKAAVQNAMKSLARLLGPDHVRVNAVAPGNVVFPGGSWERKLAEQPGFFEQYIQSEVPLQRFGCPEEIADAVVFLASKRASFITGACLVVDGGQTKSSI
ncbi:MAG TPA: SDR family oxidoreductase [Nitrospirales bacterium]|nr:SDR family oxidoreductase [Nitrospirales bacterium]